MLALQRDNQVTNSPLVEDFNTGDVLLSAGDLTAGMALGGRVFYGTRACDGWGHELGYLGVFNMNAERTLTGTQADPLSLAGDLRNEIPLPYSDAENVTASYTSMINSGEYNVFRSFVNVQPQKYEWYDVLVGFRYVNVAETAGLDFTCCIDQPNGPFNSSYDVSTWNNLIGGQLGGRFGRAWRAWAIEGWGKAGVFANVQGQHQAAIIDPTGGPGRPAQSASGVSPAMVADINFSVIYRLTNTWGIRAGYNAIWISGVALAPNQWDFSVNAGSGSGLNPTGSIFLNGANLGLEARW